MLQVFLPRLPPCKEVIYETAAVLNVVAGQQGCNRSLEERGCVLQSEWYSQVLVEPARCHERCFAYIIGVRELLPVSGLQIYSPEVFGLA